MENNEKTPYDTGVPSGPELPGTVVEYKKTLYFIAIAVIGLAVAITALYLFYLRGNGAIETKKFIALLPIWIAVFTPFIASGYKTKSQAKQKKIFIYSAIGIAALIILGIFLLVIF